MPARHRMGYPLASETCPAHAIMSKAVLNHVHVEPALPYQPTVVAFGPGTALSLLLRASHRIESPGRAIRDECSPLRATYTGLAASKFSVV